jgi:hypothetical protein
MGDFQLILLSEVNRPARKARESGAFSLISFPERFRLGAVPSALPANGDIKPNDIADWLSPKEALHYAMRCVGKEGGANAVWQLLAGGMIEAVATSHSKYIRHKQPDTSNIPSRVPKHLWQSISNNGTDLWNGGFARFFKDATTYRYFGIRLNPDDIFANLPPPRSPEAIAVTVSAPSTEPSPAPRTAANKGGRPAKAWWQDFWVEMCCRVHAGDIHPTSTQAAILEQMQQWVSDHDHEAGDTVLKDAAQKLSRALKSGSET